MVLIDSNVLLRSHPSATLYPVVQNALGTLSGQDEILCIAPQNVIEFWAVATRPIDANGLGMDAVTARKEIEGLRQLFHVLPYTSDVLNTWERIVVDQRVSGKQTHDAHLVAIMLVHAVTSILTFNVDDFARYPGISALHPALV